MRTLFTLFALALVAQIVLGEEPKPKETETLAGEWKFVTIHTDGKDNEIDNLFLVIRGSRMTIRAGDKENDDKFDLVIDPKASPKTIDVYKVNDKGERGDKLYEGIYTLQDKDLRICVNLHPGPPWNRPAAVEASDKDTETLVVLRRE